MQKKISKVVSVIMAIVMIIGCSMISELPVSAAKAKTYNAADYAAVFDAKYYAAHNPDLGAAGITSDDQLLKHFVDYGMSEGRQGSEEFNVQAYRARYADLNAVFGDDLKAYYMHYITNGKSEGRSGVANASTTPSSATPSTPTTAPAPTATPAQVKAPSNIDGRYYYTPNAKSYKPAIYYDIVENVDGSISYRLTYWMVQGSVENATFVEVLSNGVRVYKNAKDGTIIQQHDRVIVLSFTTGAVEGYARID